MQPRALGLWSRLAASSGKSPLRRCARAQARRLRPESLEPRMLLSVTTLNAVNDAYVAYSPAQLVATSGFLLSEQGANSKETLIQFDLRDYVGEAPSSAILELNVYTSSGWFNQTYESVDQNVSIDLFRKLTDTDPADGEEDPWQVLGDQPVYGDFEPESFALVEVLGTTDFQTIQVDATAQIRRALRMGDADLSGDINPQDDLEAFYDAIRDWDTYKDAHPFINTAEFRDRLDANNDGAINTADLFTPIYGGRGNGTLLGQNPGAFMSRLGIIPGDVNLDGKVDLADYNIVVNHMNQAATDYGWGDVNLDGVVTSADLTIVNSRMNQGTIGVFNAEVPLVTFSLGAGNEGYVQYASSEFSYYPNWRPKLKLDFGVPKLSSNPGATNKIFLDFDGHNVTGTIWNSAYGNPVISTQKFDLDGNPNTFNADERRQMELIWAYVAEDFRPFNVDVTTIDPSIANPNAFNTVGGALRVLFTSEIETDGFTDWLPGQYAGIAWPGSTNSYAWNVQEDMPVFVLANDFDDLHGFYVTDGFDPNNYVLDDDNFDVDPWPIEMAGTVASHEIGHAFGLWHDGVNTPGDFDWYYGGYAGDNGYDGSGVEETSWAPIMGGGEIRYLTQWSKGEYQYAYNQVTNQDDLAILAAALGYRNDDYASPGWLALGYGMNTGTISQSAAGSGTNDTDTFQFTIYNTTKYVTITARPEEIVGNLDIGLRLYNASLSVNAFAAPAATASATIAMNLAPGTYYLEVDGVGRAANTSGYAYDDGYSDYGSLGRYYVTSTVAIAQSGSGGLAFEFESPPIASAAAAVHPGTIVNGARAPKGTASARGAGEEIWSTYPQATSSPQKRTTIFSRAASNFTVSDDGILLALADRNRDRELHRRLDRSAESFARGDHSNYAAAIDDALAECLPLL